MVSIYFNNFNTIIANTFIIIYIYHFMLNLIICSRILEPKKIVGLLARRILLTKEMLFRQVIIGEAALIISEYRHWEETHRYLLEGSEQCLLMGTGLGICNISEEVTK